ncbi:MAG: rod shape-determining protein MreC [Spirochaetia bacterium]
MLQLRGFFQKHRTGLVFAGLLCVSSISMVFSTNTVSFRPDEIGLSIFSFFQQTVSGVTNWFSETIYSIQELAELQEDYEELQDRVFEMQTYETELEELRLENERLSELLNFSESIEFDHIAAQIIAKDPENIFNSIQLNRGRVHGIQPGMPVIAYYDGYQGLVGRIRDVGLYTSIILPVYDSGSYVAARLQETRYEGMVNGSGISEDQLFMQYVRKQAIDNIEYGDLVVTSGMSSVFPEGIYIGRVRAIQARDYETSLHIQVEPVIDFRRLENVFILRVLDNES